MTRAEAICLEVGGHLYVWWFQTGNQCVRCGHDRNAAGTPFQAPQTPETGVETSDPEQQHTEPQGE